MAINEAFNNNELSAGDLAQALKVALTEATELQITTTVVPTDGDSVDATKPSDRLYTRLNIVDSEIENEIGRAFVNGGPYAKLLEFHLSQASQAPQMVHQKLKILEQLSDALAAMQTAGIPLTEQTAGTVVADAEPIAAVGTAPVAAPIHEAFTVSDEFVDRMALLAADQPLMVTQPSAAEPLHDDFVLQEPSDIGIAETEAIVTPSVFAEEPASLEALPDLDLFGDQLIGDQGTPDSEAEPTAEFSTEPSTDVAPDLDLFDSQLDLPDELPLATDEDVAPILVDDTESMAELADDIVSTLHLEEQTDDEVEEPLQSLEDVPPDEPEALDDSLDEDLAAILSLDTSDESDLNPLAELSSSEPAEEEPSLLLVDDVGDTESVEELADDLAIALTLETPSESETLSEDLAAAFDETDETSLESLEAALADTFESSFENDLSSETGSPSETEEPSLFGDGLDMPSFSSFESEELSFDLGAVSEPSMDLDLGAIAEPSSDLDFDTISEPSAELDLGTTAEPPTEFDFDTLTEPSAELDLGTIADPSRDLDFNAITEPPTEFDFDTIAEPSAELDLGTIAEPSLDLDFDAIAEAAPEFDFDAISEPSAELDLGTTAESLAEFDFDTLTEPSAELDLGAIAEPSNDLDLDAIAETPTEFNFDAVTEPTDEFDLGAIAEPSGELDLESALDSSDLDLGAITEPADEFDFGAGAEPSAELDLGAIAEPSGELDFGEISDPFSPESSQSLESDSPTVEPPTSDVAADSLADVDLSDLLSEAEEPEPESPEGLQDALDAWLNLDLDNSEEPTAEELTMPSLQPSTPPDDPFQALSESYAPPAVSPSPFAAGVPDEAVQPSALDRTLSGYEEAAQKTVDELFDEAFGETESSDEMFVTFFDATSDPTLDDVNPFGQFSLETLNVSASSGNAARNHSSGSVPGTQSGSDNPDEEDRPNLPPPPPYSN